MLAHLTALLSLLAGTLTSGLGSVVTLLVPLAMYLYFSNRSRYVAFHALQATVFQAAAAIVIVVLGALVGGTIAVAWVVAGVLSMVLIGLLLMPVALGITIVGGGALAIAPFAAVAYALYGAYLVTEGRDFRYWLIGDAVWRSMGLGAASPASVAPTPPASMADDPAI